MKSSDLDSHVGDGESEAVGSAINVVFVFKRSIFSEFCSFCGGVFSMSFRGAVVLNSLLCRGVIHNLVQLELKGFHSCYYQCFCLQRRLIGVSS